MDDAPGASTPAADDQHDEERDEPRDGRPAVHLTPPRGWLSDPNGLLSVDGRHHLFYQHNPNGIDWGAMHWGHAVSTDFVSWQNLPVALGPDAKGQIYSGSAVTDVDDTAGFGAGAMVAVFTYHVEGAQSQAVASSTDGGRTFVKFSGNPVIPAHPDRPMCRDPKVFWHGDARSGHWVMALAATTEIWIYVSDDLRSWTHTDAVVGFEHGDRSLETPDLFELAADDGTRQWVLTAGIMQGAPAGGTGTSMMVGDFDGERFTPTSQPHWVDHGAHFYAAQSWNDLDSGRRVWIGWMGNWMDTLGITDRPWRGQMSIPRELSLRVVDGAYRLDQTPVGELEGRRRGGVDERSVAVTTAAHHVDVGGRAIDVAITLAAAQGHGLRVIARRGGGTVVVEVDRDTDQLSVELPALAGRAPGTSLPRRVGVAPGDLQLRIILDVGSIEVIGGAASISDALIVDESPWELALEAIAGECVVERLRVHPLDPAGADARQPTEHQGALSWQP